MASSKKRTKKTGQKPVARQPQAYEYVPTWFSNCLKLLVYGYIALLPWLFLPSVTVVTASQYWILIWATTLVSGLMLYGYAKEWLPVPRSRFFPIAIAWVVVVSLSTIFSSNRFLSLWGSYQVWSDGLVFLACVLLLVNAFLSLRPTRKDIRLLLDLLLVQAFILSLGTIGEAVSKGFPAKPIRSVSSLYNSDYFISYALLILPLALALTVEAWRKVGAKWARAAYIIVSLALAGGLFVCMPYSVQDMAYKLPQALHLVSLPAHSEEESAQASSKVSQFLGNTSNSERFTQWELGAQIGREHLLVGNGLGTTRQAFFEIEANQDIPGWGYERGVAMDHPHNDIIEQFATTGVVGAIFYVLMWLSFFWLLYRNRKQIQVEDRSMAWGLGLGLLLFLTFNQFLFTSFVSGVIYPFWMAMLLMLSGQIAYIKLAGRKPVYGVVTLALLLVLGYASYNAWNQYQGEYYYTQALANKDSSDPMNSVLLAADLAQNAAAAYPKEGVYQWFAADTGLTLYFQPPAQINLTDKEGLASEILRAADESVEREPYNPVYNLTRGIARYLFSPSGSEAEKSGQVAIDEAIRLDPKFYSLYIKAGNAYGVKKDYAKALEYYEKALPLAPENERKSIEGSMADLKKLQAAS